MKNAVIIIGYLVLMLLISPIAMAVPNSNSIIQDDIEYYVQTDKSVYDLGENVEMLFRVTNLRDEDVTILCSRTGEFNFSLRQNIEVIWTRSHRFSWNLSRIDLSAGQSTDVSHVWDMIDDTNSLVDQGIYDVIGIMYNEPWNYYNYGEYIPTEVSVPINIVPEPSSLALFMACLSVLIRNKRVKHS